ncbi:MAG TPA: dynamin family protein [Streptosporangiaceae bacterium]|nr:dynamin family protein [Streptosporangiaceae bacterium]
MLAPDVPDVLLSAVDDLAPMAGAADAAALTALGDRLRAARLRVLVVGEAKRGKSTLVNALLGRQVLPVGITPLTAVPTTVTHGTDEGLEVAFADGAAARFPLAALDELGTERGNPANRRGIAAITVRIDAPVLAGGVEIVDTPGTGSVYAHNTAAADAVLPTMDAAIFVLTADPPVSASERELLGRVRGLSVTTFVVLNKADHADPADLAEAVEFSERAVSEPAGQRLRVYPVSARAALTAGDPGFSEFAADFAAYLEASGVTDLRRSAAAQVRRIAAGLLDEAALARRAAEMGSREAADRVCAFAVRLEAVGRSGTASADVAEAESARMLADLNAAAGRETSRLAADVRAAIGGVLDGELADAPVAELERRGRQRMVRLTLAAAEAWRQTQRERLEDGLARIETRVARDLEAELAAVRDTAAELLGLELAVPAPAGRLTGRQRFFFSADEHVDQAELLAGAVRRRVPGGLGRRLARDHLLAEVDDLAARQIGRARGDLQYRLAEATRELVAAVGRRYAASTDRLTGALQTAAALREQSAAQAAGKLRELADRERELQAIQARLSDGSR